LSADVTVDTRTRDPDLADADALNSTGAESR
jgi:hypothetical protein